jgi:hypothetical protein
MTGGLDGNVVVVGKVDTGALLGGIVGNTEKFALKASIGGTRNVLAVAPLAVSGATG